MDHLREAGAPIGVTRIYSAADDPNELLGRPGGYIGKANFHDTRLPAPTVPGLCEPPPPGQSEPICPDVPEDPEIRDGGSVEVFATAEAAENRATYVRAITQSGGPFAEYSYLAGTVFLRISASLTPENAVPYEQALDRL